MTLVGFILCAAGILLGILSWDRASWGLGILALAIFLFGVWILRRSARESGDLIGDTIDIAIDIADD